MTALGYVQISVPLKQACPEVTCFEIPKVPKGHPKIIHLQRSGRKPVWSTHPLPLTGAQLEDLIRQLESETT